MDGMDFTIKIEHNNMQEILRTMQSQLKTALEDCGLDAENYAMDELTRSGAVDTGALRNSIKHDVDVSDANARMTVGTNMEYGIYVELGTGKYADGGRRTPWVYYDAVRDKYFMTDGMQARPYIKPAIADHIANYKHTIEGHLKA